MCSGTGLLLPRRVWSSQRTMIPVTMLYDYGLPATDERCQFGEVLVSYWAGR